MMASRKRKPSKRARNHRRGRPRDDDLLPMADDLPDPRALERVLRQFASSMFGEADDEAPLSQAQKLMDIAFDTDDPQQQVQLAQQALMISPDCADAYVVLAGHAESTEEAFDMYQQAVEAGERAMGKDASEKYTGHFWGVLETRPYMRARHELANFLWLLGRHDEAVGHYQEMLRLNPADNQGVRYALARSLLQLDRDDDLETLLEAYQEDGAAEWFYSRALLAYRREGDTQRSRELLHAAERMNPHIPAYMLGNKQIPEDAPACLGFGDESEAADYAGNYLPVWKDTPGAIPWLRKTLNVALPTAPKRHAKSWRWWKEEVAELPQNEDEVWHFDTRRISLSSKQGKTQNAPWALVVTSPGRQQVVGTHVVPEKPSNPSALEWLLRMMLDPEEGDPRRPGVICVRLKNQWEAWRNKLAETGIECHQRKEMEDIDFMVDSLAQSFRLRTGSSNVPPRSEAELAQLPQIAEETWEADFRLLAAWIGNQGEPQRPWCAIVSNRTEDTIVAQDLTTEEPGEDWLGQLIRKAISSPATGEPHRPGSVAVRSEAFCGALRPWLSRLGVDCVVQGELDHMDFIFDDLTRHMAGEDATPALLDAPGVRPHHVAGFFDAAAQFYRQAPWRVAPSDVPIRVECDRFQSGPWYAVVMGQSGMVQGLALYEDLELLRRIIAGSLSDRENARLTSSLAMHFNEAFEMPARDLHHAETHRWPVAGSEAYPLIVRVNPGMSIRRPLVWELELMEGCLRAIPGFLQEQRPDTSTCEVATSSGRLTLKLTWIDRPDKHFTRR